MPAFPAFCRRPALFAILALSGLPFASSAASTVRDHPLRSNLTIVDPAPWSANGTASAVVMSPAVLGGRPRPELMYGRLAVQSGPFDGDDMFYLRGKRFGVGTERVRPSEGAFSTASAGEAADSLASPSFRRYTFAFASPSSPRTSFGFSYTYIRSDDGDFDGLSSIDLALSGRLSPRYTFHFTARNVNRSRLGDTKLARYYELGTRGTYWKNRVGLFAQWAVLEGGLGDGGLGTVGAEARRGSSLLLRARVDTEGNAGIGTEFLFSSYSLGFHYLVDDAWDSGLFTYLRIFAGP